MSRLQAWVLRRWCAWRGHRMTTFAWPEEALRQPGAVVRLPTVALVQTVDADERPWTPRMVLRRDYCARCYFVPGGRVP